MRYFLLIILSVLAEGSCLYAQSHGSLVERINSIKSQSDTYYWDQYTHPNADTARVGAIKRLILQIEYDLKDKEHFSVEEIEPYADVISINRGSMKQNFAYISKDVALNIKSGNVPPKPAQQADDNVIASSAGAAAVTPVDEAAHQEAADLKPRTKEKFVPDAFTMRICEAKSFTTVYRMLKSLQASGQILQYGKLSDVEDYSSLDLILFDMKSQEIISMLSSETEPGKRTNLIDGSQDSLSNYPAKMTAVIWYIKK